MAVTLDITPELEAQVRAAAARQGLDADSFILNVLEERLRVGENIPPRLTETEASLLQKINQGLAQEVWQRYTELVAKRQAETLTAEEHEALILLSDQIEQANATRMDYLIQLAQLRQVSLASLMQNLGIPQPADG